MADAFWKAAANPATTDLLVQPHGVEQRIDGSRGHINRQSQPPEQCVLPAGVGCGQQSEPDGHLGFRTHPDGDRFPVDEAAVQRGFDRMPNRVAVVQHLAGAAFRLVLLHDARLERDAAGEKW